MATEVQAALNKVGKSMDSDNGRKIRPTLYMMFLSWAQHKDTANQLAVLLAKEPWSCTATEIDAVVSKLGAIFKTLGKQAAKPAKKFREKVKIELFKLTESEELKKVFSRTQSSCIISSCCDVPLFIAAYVVGLASFVDRVDNRIEDLRDIRRNPNEGCRHHRVRGHGHHS